MRFTQSLNALLLFTMLSTVTLQANGSDNTLLVDCSDTNQNQCIMNEIQTFEPTFATCPSGTASVSLDLTSYAEKKHPGTPPSDITKKSREDWINAVSQFCMSEAAKTAPEEAKKKSHNELLDNSSWVNQFMLGYSFHSAYNEDKNHEGLKEENVFAQFGFDGRWFTSNKKVIHWEIGGLFGNSATLTETDEAEPEDNEDTQNTLGLATVAEDTVVTADANNQSNDPTFNDVSQSFDFYTKVTYNFWTDPSEKLKDYFAVGALAGFKAKDTIAADLDSVSYYYGLLAEYRYYGQNMYENKNTIPRGKVWIAPVIFEEYGGAEDQKRLLVVGEWQLNHSEDAEPEEGRFVVGMKANLGDGADDVAVFFAYRSGFDSIRTFLTN